MILSNNFPEYTLLDVESDDEGRKVMVNINIDKMVLTLISIYAPNDTSQQIKFFQDLDVWTRRYSKAPQSTIIGEDCNCCDKSDRQSKNQINQVGL